MQVRLISDIHLEHHPDAGSAFLSEISKNPTDLLLIAGDLGSLEVPRRYKSFLASLCSSFPAVAYVPGNHEYYDKNFLDTWEKLYEISEGLENLKILDKDSYQPDPAHPVEVAGATLWFPRNEASTNPVLQAQISDFRAIKELREFVWREHQEAVRYFEQCQADIWLLHHLPSPSSIHSKYLGNPLNCFFLGDLTRAIKLRQPKLVVHGHTHKSCNYRDGTTRILCNPYGYKGIELNPNFDWQCDLVL